MSLNKHKKSVGLSIRMVGLLGTLKYLAKMPISNQSEEASSDTNLLDGVVYEELVIHKISYLPKLKTFETAYKILAPWLTY